MNPKTLELLEFPKIRVLLVEHAHFSASKALAEELMPATEPEAVEALLAETAEARELLRLHPNFTIGPAHDVRGLVDYAARGGVLDPAALLEVSDTVRSGRMVREMLVRRAEAFPLLSRLARDIMRCDPLQGAIEQAIGPDADVLDSASPLLRSLRLDVRAVHNQLLDRMQALVRAPEYLTYLQDPIVTLRSDRYVLPVKAEFRSRVKGIVHDESASGATVFVEPLDVVEINNRWRSAQREEQREVDRILRALSTEVGVYQQELTDNVGTLAAIDIILAKARYADAIKAEQPTVVAGYRFSFRQAKHPLLTGKVVPIDVYLGQDPHRERQQPFYVLVITGPNTGGKTVALKTVGLLTLMGQCGLHLPVAIGSRLAVFRQVHADIGDEQSIEQSLSTFSSHLSKITPILDEADERSLVLFDELGAGTDPQEGSALAQAILLYLRDKRVPTVATSHFSAVKALAHVEASMQNASVEFDVERLAPTYVLSIGMPGTSHALQIAGRLGLNPAIAAEAEARFSPTEQAVDALMVSLREETEQLKAEREDLANDRTDLEAQRDTLAARVREMEEAITEQRIAAWNQATEEAGDLLQQIEALVRQAKAFAAPIDTDRKLLEHAATQAREREREMRSQARAVRQAPEPQDLAVGDTVRVRGWEMPGQVLATPDTRGLVEMQVGQIKTRVHLGEITLVEAQDPGPAPESRHRDTAPAAPVVPVELDIRGNRAEESIGTVDRYLDQALHGGLKNVRIIHGKGTGALRTAVHEVLRGHPLVRRYRTAPAQEGGDGATVVELAQ
ncbi:MAG: endonuclease MutS2 [Chloroflexota bacterium]|nr:endonuclease MutS2 [Chloroflexota bacterium]MDE2931802.1 endonuclease MutS2 [Chloroflexota bacterium]